MQQITEQQILALAPNAAAAANGRKISDKGGFVRLECSADDTYYWGECTGSGKSNYITSIDFIDPAAPLIRCSCPSRQFPCKHGLALMYEIMKQKPFAPCEIPEDILKKREKKQSREEKKAQPPEEGTPKAEPKINKSARTKKLKKQLEGLDLLQKLVQDLLKAGLGTMGSVTLSTYRQLAKQLGDYYLPGPQRLLNKLIMEMAAFQNDGQDDHYEAAVKCLEDLHALEKKSRQYLSAKLESGAVEQDDNVLYEELGGVWKLAELEQLGLYKNEAKLLQLAFWVDFDKARNEYIDTGCWLDLDTGEIDMTYNYRPIKALQYVKQEDSFFGVAEIPSLVYYPGDGNRRVRWDGAVLRETVPDDLAKARRYSAQTLAPAVKQAKNLLKNALSAPMLLGLYAYARIGQINDDLVLEDGAGDRILLGDLPGMESTVDRLRILPEASLWQDQVLLGGLFYDGPQKRMVLMPFSIVTETKLVRLLY